MAITACQTATTAAVQSSGSFFCLAFAVAEMVFSAAVADATMAVATTAAFGSSYCFSSAVMVLDLAAAAADAAHHGTTLADVTTAVAANFFENGLGGILGCPSCHESNPAMTETLKLFLPYFPLHIQSLIQQYLKLLEFMHTFEMIQNMMNHMEEINSIQKMMEGGNLVDEFTYMEEPSSSGWNGS